MIDQYRVKTDKRSGIVNDPNRAADPQYIVRLIGKVISVSLETVRDCRKSAGVGGGCSSDLGFSRVADCGSQYNSPEVG